ncbi:MAG: hypothetical protein AAFW70_04115 [Cyanobacteria bacterium J06635_10]
MNEENQVSKQSNTNDQKSDDSSRSPGVDKISPGTDPSNSEDASKDNTEGYKGDNETK